MPLKIHGLLNEGDEKFMTTRGCENVNDVGVNFFIRRVAHRVHFFIFVEPSLRPSLTGLELC